MKRLLLISALFCFGILPAQIDKTKKLPANTKTLQVKEKPIQLNREKIPFFDNVKTIKNHTNLVMTDKEIIPVSEFSNMNRPKNYINLKNIKPLNSSVNGTLTPRDNYMNDNLYLEFLDNDVNPLENRSRCKCTRTDIGFVNTIFRVEAGKRYLITYDLSPLESRESATVWVMGFGNDVSQSKNVRRENDILDLVIRPETTGMFKLMMQCADPLTNSSPFYFNSVTIQTVE